MSPPRSLRRSRRVPLAASATALAVSFVAVGAGALAASPVTVPDSAHARAGGTGRSPRSAATATHTPVRAAAVPAVPSPTTQPGPAALPKQDGQDTAYSDPLSALGARSPFCSRDVGSTAQRDCRASGSVAHPYPVSSYGIDNQVSFGITNVGDNLLGALQDVAAFGWLVLVYLVKGVLLLLEWGFSVDLLNSAMAAVRSALDTLHRTVLGQPWFLAAIAVAGLWGIWRGLVQRRATQTIGGLVATVALMIAALVVISNPVATVGQASKLADDGALGVAAATSGATVRAPAQSFATALEGLFTTTVLKPWAALEFGDVRWALSPARADSPVTNADVWLIFPAGSSQRAQLYKLQKGQSLGGGGLFDGLAGSATPIPLGPLGQALGLAQGLHDISQANASELSDAVKDYVHKDPSKVTIQEAGGTFPRLALLGLISLGLVGAILLFLYVGVKLLLASIMSLLLVLLAPAMLLAPAFGDSGRATTVAWGKRLAGNLAAKLIYALLLAILLTASSAIESLEIGWVATWLLLIAFWWGVLLKRKELIGFISVGHHERGGGGSFITRAYHATRLAEAAWRPIGRVHEALDHARAGELRQPWAADPEAHAEADRLSRETTETAHARGVQRAGATEAARDRLARRWRLERELDEIDATLHTSDVRGGAPDRVEGSARAARAQAQDTPRGRDVADVGTDALRRRREQVIAALHSEAGTSPRLSDAELMNPSMPAPGAPRSLAREPDFERWREQRLADVENRDLPLDDPRHLRAAGIDPEQYAASSDERRAELRDHVRTLVDRDRHELAELRAAEPPATADDTATAGEIDHRSHLRPREQRDGMPDRSRRHVR